MFVGSWKSLGVCAAILGLRATIIEADERMHPPYDPDNPSPELSAMHRHFDLSLQKISKLKIEVTYKTELIAELDQEISNLHETIRQLQEEHIPNLEREFQDTLNECSEQNKQLDAQVKNCFAERFLSELQNGQVKEERTLLEQQTNLAKEERTLLEQQTNEAKEQRALLEHQTNQAKEQRALLEHQTVQAKEERTLLELKNDQGKEEGTVLELQNNQAKE